MMINDDNNSDDNNDDNSTKLHVMDITQTKIHKHPHPHPHPHTPTHTHTHTHGERERERVLPHTLVLQPSERASLWGGGAPASASVVFMASFFPSP